MDFDQLGVVLLLTGDDPPELDEDAAGSIQDAHLAHLAALHDAGALVAAGPSPSPDDPTLRGLAFVRGDAETAAEAFAADPAVLAGVFKIATATWFCPAGAMQFTPTFFPSSRADATR